MELRSQIIDFGIAAVKKFRREPAIRSENAIPEMLIGLSIASSLIEAGCDARVEVPLPQILKEHGLGGSDTTPKFGGQRADLAIYAEEKASAVIEMKIVDERRPRGGILNDWSKLALLRAHFASKQILGPSTYIGALVCDLANGRKAEETVRALTDDLGVHCSAVVSGPRETAVAGGWGWLFMCVQVA